MTTPRDTPAATMQPSVAWSRWRWLMAALWGAWALSWIGNARIELEGVSWSLLFDDAMISMRYAAHIAAGHGPVWNVGDAPIEGYTNPLWVGLMAFVHLSGLPLNLTSLPIQLFSAATVVVAALATGRLVDRWVAPAGDGDQAAAHGAAGTLAAGWVLGFGPLSTWSLLGMEVGASAALTALALWCLAERRWRSAYGLMALGLLLRPDAILVAGGALGALAWLDPAQRRRHLLVGGGVVAATALGLLLARLAVFGEPLPNTYYLKLTGFPLGERLTRGALVTGEALLRLGLAPVLLPLAWALRRGSPAARAAAAVVGLHVVYSVWVGGDAWERGDSNRYLSTAMPLSLGLLAAGLLQSGAGRALSRPAALAALVALGAVGFNAWGGAASLREAALVDPPMNHAFRKAHLEQALSIRALTSPKARVAVVAAGVIPYVSERPCIDLLGKNDRTIARMKGRVLEGWGAKKRFYPGHNKWDYAHSIGALKPDVVTPLWGDAREAAPHLKGRYTVIKAGPHPMYLREGSPHIRWRLLGR